MHTFLIADIRGYTAFTQSHGDEQAARLARAFADLAGEAIATQGGAIVELRGDEVLAVFGSPRMALRASIDLLDRVASHRDQPFEIGVGIDSGEAVPVDDGYRGGALNVAARLCSLAAPGRILTTDVVTHLARKVEGLRYIDQGSVNLNGMDSSIRVIEVQREGGELTTSSRALRRTDSSRLAPFDDLFRGLGEDFSRHIGDQIHASLAASLARQPVPTPIAPRAVEPKLAKEPDPASPNARARELAVIFGGVTLIVAIIAVVLIVIVMRL